jgi:DNA-binding Lrp family transcriptional regulator
MTRGQRLRVLFTLSRPARTWFIAALVLPLLLGAAFALLILLAPASAAETLASAETSFAGLTLIVTGVFLLPPAALITLVAAFREPRHPPRAFLFLFSALLVLLAGLSLSAYASIDGQAGSAAASTLTVNAAMPLALLVSLPGIYSAARALPELRAVLEEDTSKRVLRILLARGSVSFAGLSKAVGISPAEVGERVDQLLVSGQLAGSMDGEQKWVYTAAYLAEKQLELLRWVSERGRVRLDDLARLLKVSAEITTEWIYQLAQREQFDGYINWKQGMIYAATAGRIGLASQCPQCGGQLSPAPGDSIVCLYCGTEAWRAV